MKTLPIALLLAVAAFCAVAQSAYCDDAAPGALASAQENAAALARQEAQAEDDLRAAAAAVKDANSLAQQKAAALDNAKSLAAASPNDASLADAAKKAAAESDDAARAAATAKTAMDAKTTEALSLGERLHAAVKIVADAKSAEANAGRRAWAQGRVDAASALAKKSHLVAMVIVDQGGEKSTAFRYDRFPSVERVGMKEGEFFVRPAGKSWMASAYWDGAHGAPVPAKRAAELDAMATLAFRALEPAPAPPDAHEGNVMWTPTADPGYRFVQSREHPRDGAVYPLFEFTDNANENAGILPREVVAPGDWRGAPAEVTVDYFYIAGEAAPPATAPEAQIIEALRAAVAKPVKVDMTLREFGAAAWGDNSINSVTHTNTRVAGIVSGRDFDLTVTKEGKSTRQIALGNDAWATTDAGKTWTKLPLADRRYYNAIADSMESTSVVGWLLGIATTKATGNGPDGKPFEYTVRAISDISISADPAGDDGEAQERIKLGDGTLSYVLATPGGKPPVLRRIAGLGSAGWFDAAYAEAPGGKGVLAPPGNDAAIPEATPPPAGK